MCLKIIIKIGSSYTYKNKKTSWQPFCGSPAVCVECFCLCSLTDVNLFLAASDYPDQARFSWSLYLEETGAKAVAADAFKVVRTKKCDILDSAHSVRGNYYTQKTAVSV